MNYNNSGIYRIMCKINGKSYYGQSANIAQRLSFHLSDLLNKEHHNSALQEDFEIYGADNFLCEVVEFVPVEDLNTIEQIYLDLTNRSPAMFYNIGREAKVVRDYQKLSKQSFPNSSFIL